MLIIPHSKWRNRTGASRSPLQQTDCVKCRGEKGKRRCPRVVASTGMGSTGCKGSPVMSSANSGTNVMLVIAPDVPISIYGLPAPATSLLSLNSFHEGQFRKRRVLQTTLSTHADMVLGKAFGSVGIWCAGGRKSCGKKKKRWFKLAIFPSRNKAEFTTCSAQTSSLFCKNYFQILCNSHSST